MTGSVLQRSGSRRRLIATDEHTSTIMLAAIAANPQTSSRDIAHDIGVCHQSALTVLHRHSFHPSRVHCLQALNDHDYEVRAEYCNWLLSCCDDDPHITEKVMWTDETQFSWDGVVNTHNSHYYQRFIMQCVVEDHMDSLPLAQASRTWFQQDGAAPHFALNTVSA